jgi:hypothetical protein
MRIMVANPVLPRELKKELPKARASLSAWESLPTSLWVIVSGMEIALLFCAIRLTETLGTVAFSRDTRAGW